MTFPLGTGQRFNSLKSKLSARPGVTDPAALAAFIGRKKYGKKGMAALSQHKSPYQSAIDKAK